MSGRPPDDDRLDEAVRKSVERRGRAERDEEASFARGIAMIGALGWTIVVPALLGLFLGRWLDARFGHGIFWTLSLLFAGVAAGFVLAWKRMHRE